MNVTAQDQAKMMNTTTEKFPVSFRRGRRMWPTPTVNDAKNRAGAEQFNRNSYPLNAAVAISNGGEKIPQNMGKMINPKWNEWLMGWPVGWTDLKPLETAKFQQWCEKHGTGLRK